MAYGHEYPPPGYGAPPPGPAAAGHPPPGYGAPPPGYGYPPPEYAGYPPPPEYGHYPPPPGGAPPGHPPPAGAPPPEYGAAPPGYGAPPPGYGAPPAASAGYGPPPPGYGAPPDPRYDPYGYGPPPPGYPGYGYPPPEYAAHYPPPPGYPGYPPNPYGYGYGPAPVPRDDRDRRKDDKDGKRKRGGRGKDEKGAPDGYGRAGDKGGGKGDRSAPYRDRDARDENPQANNLYVTGVPAEVDDSRLKEVFLKHGRVLSCKVLPPRPGENKTVALVRMERESDAQRAKDALNNSTLPDTDKPINVRFAENKNARSSNEEASTTPSGAVKVTGSGIDGIVTTFEAVGPLKANRGHEHHKGQLYIAGLPPDTGNVHLYRLFAPFGSIGPKGVHAMMDSDGKCKGIAFVNFLEEDSAQLAIATYNGAVLPDGTAMKVSMKQSKAP